MPEGPEVKRISEYLNNFFRQNSILDISILKGRYLKKLPDGFKDIKFPLAVKKIKTKGKFIYFILNNDISIWNTLGMSGYWSTLKKKHANVCFKTNKGNIYFIDQRNFGTLKFCYDYNCLESKLNNIGPDMLSLSMNYSIFYERIKIKRNLKKK